jgi:NADH-quinone oxidoreductase subunit L
MTCDQYVSWGQFSQGHTLIESLQCFFQHAPIESAAAGNALWMIIALPLLGAFLTGVFGKWMGRANVNLIACASVFGSFLLSLLVFWTIADSGTRATAGSILPQPYAVGFDYGTWFQAGTFRVGFGLFADHLSGSMLLVITGVGFLIHVYSTEYMSHDAAYWRFFAYLNLFVAMMLTLVLADNLVLLFVGWEGVGMCSYLLIGFWYDDDQKAFAGRKAFITNRIGDFGFLLGSFLLVLGIAAFSEQATNGNFANPEYASAFKGEVSRRGPLAFTSLETWAQSLPPGNSTSAVTLSTPVAHGPLSHVAGVGLLLGKGAAPIALNFGQVLALAMLLFLLGAAGKSAQFPLYVWLPDAMAGPTPVSALIHAATMVTSGIYLFCRLNFLLVMAPRAMAIMAVVGAITALLAALIAFAQTDLKKVLAYSTVSQLGIMFMGLGGGVFWAAFLHVVTHAMFKACLFLGAGSVMHGNNNEGDATKLGGLRDQMPATHITFLIATLTITGMVPFSGFFSKDAILHGLHSTTIVAFPRVLTVVWVMGLLAAGCTAFYMMRLYFLAFQGDRAKDAQIPASQVHESGLAMTGPLVVLAILSIVFLAQGLPFMDNAHMNGPKQTVMENFLTPVFRTSDNFLERTRGSVLKVGHHEAAAEGGEHAAAPAEEGPPWGAWAQAWAIALLSGGAAFALYRKGGPFRPGGTFPEFLKPFREASRNKFYVDEFYEMALIRPIKNAAFVFFKVIDQLLIDTVGVKGAAWVTARAGSMLRYFQTGDAQTYAAAMVLALAGCVVWALMKVMH